MHIVNTSYRNFNETPPYISKESAILSSKKIYLSVLFTGLLFLLSGAFFKSHAQTMPFPPPRDIMVYQAQGLNFGEFYPASGGEIEVSPSGNCTASGGVVHSGGNCYPACLIVELLPGRLVHINYSSTATLSRIGGGGSMTMEIGPTDKPGDQFVTNAGHPFHTWVYIGGTLQVGPPSANPAGDYSGSFEVTFIQE
jgi:hypothetical protein